MCKHIKPFKDIYRDNLKTTYKSNKDNKPVEKWAKDLNMHFEKEEAWLKSS